MSTEPRKASLLIVFLTVFIDLLGFGMVLPLLPIYAESFGVDEHGVTIALLMSCFSAMQFLFAPLWGRLSDRIGRRPVLMIGLAGSTIFYTLFGLATLLSSLPLLFLSRLGAGIAGATISTAQAYIADSTTLKDRAARHGADRRGVRTGLHVRSAVGRRGAVVCPFAAGRGRQPLARLRRRHFVVRCLTDGRGDLARIAAQGKRAGGAARCSTCRA